jgi:hypothetical protein
VNYLWLGCRWRSPAVENRSGIGAAAHCRPERRQRRQSGRERLESRSRAGLRAPRDAGGQSSERRRDVEALEFQLNQTDGSVSSSFLMMAPTIRANLARCGTRDAWPPNRPVCLSKLSAFVAVRVAGRGRGAAREGRRGRRGRSGRGAHNEMLREPRRCKRRRPFGAGAEGGRIIWETGAVRGGFIAARTISTVADYATTGVRRQENVRVLFRPYGTSCSRSALWRSPWPCAGSAQASSLRTGSRARSATRRATGPTSSARSPTPHRRTRSATRPSRPTGAATRSTSGAN